MATIVKLHQSRHHAILLDTGHAMYQSEKEAGFIAKTKKGESNLACVAAADGKILWWPTEDFAVVSVDGQTPAQILAPFLPQNPINS